MSMKKGIAIVFVLVFLLTLATACGKTDEDSQVTTPTPTPSSTSSGSDSVTAKPEEEDELGWPIVEEPTSFTMWVQRTLNVQSGLNTWSDSDVFKELERITNVKCEALHTAGATTTATEQFNLILTSGDFPDVFSGGDWKGGFDRYIDEEVLIDLSDMYEKFAPHIMDHLNLSELVRKAVVTDMGRMPAIPLIQHQSVPGPTAGLCFRGDWLDELGIAPDSVKTYDDLREVLQTMKERYNLKYPFGFTMDAYNSRVSKVYTYGFNASPTFVYDETGKVTFGPMLSYYRDFLITYHDLIRDGFIDPDINKYRRADLETEWYNSEMAFGFGMAYYAGNSAVLKGIVEDPDFYIIGVDEPKIREDIQLHTGEYHTYNAGEYTYNNAYTITTACEIPEIVLRWFDYCFTEEGKLLTNYGFEGDTYVMVDGVPTWTDKITNNPDMPSLEATQQRYLWHFPPYTEFDKELTTYPDKRQNDSIAAWQSSTDHAWCLPLNYTFTVDESAEYSSLFGDIETFVLENMALFLAGMKDPRNDAEWNEYVNLIKGMNIDRVLELVTAAVERYNNR